MSTLHLDLESRSECDLRKHGLMRYARHPSTRIMMISWAVDDEPVQLWEAHLESEMPERLLSALTDPNIKKVAWNSQFEMTMLEFVLGIEIVTEQWECAMVKSLALALPASLKECGEVVGLPQEQQKLKTGATLIRRFCMPREPTKTKDWRWSTPYNEPEDWKLFCEYCVQDTDTERRLWKRLSKFYVPQSEWDLWHLDQRINRRGIPVDVEFCRAALDVAKAEKHRLIEEMRAITKLKNPGSQAQILPWLKARNYPFSDMRKERVAKALEDFDNWDQRPPKPEPLPDYYGVSTAVDHVGRKITSITTYSDAELDRIEAERKKYESDLKRHETFAPLDDDAKAVLRLHQQSSRSSWKKYQAILDYEFEGRLYFQLQFCGAGRTGRWAGRGVQLQNLPRPGKYHVIEIRKGEEILDPWIRELIMQRDVATLHQFYGDVMACLASAIRSAIRTQDGMNLVVADLASIESRVIGWIANCETLLDVFREGKCAYKSFATRMFRKAYDEITKGERGLAKPAVLGCGFMLSGGDEQGDYPDVMKTGLWGYAAAMGIQMTREQARESVRIFRETYVEIVDLWYDLQSAAFEAVRTQKPQIVGCLQFDVVAPFLRMRLPSGRFLYYLRPKLEPRKVKMPNGDIVTRTNLTYEGYDKRRQWTRIPTHPGKIVENAVQAIARDVMAFDMVNADDEGYDLCATTHDELIAEMEVDTLLDHHELARIMSRNPPWAMTMPLGAEGYTDSIYRK